ncbi:hypothetical protein J6590_023741 [Homalodisca vitripennis]|nr:hypothetical protein J6590_023741 [Homalodisca vitripennis]
MGTVDCPVQEKKVVINLSGRVLVRLCYPSVQLADPRWPPEGVCQLFRVPFVVPWTLIHLTLLVYGQLATVTLTGRMDQEGVGWPFRFV